VPCSKAAIRRWRDKNAERDRANAERYRPIRNARQRAKFAADPTSFLESQRRRRARKHDALVHDVPDTMVWEFNPAGPGVCNYCGCDLAFDQRTTWHIDHVVPLSRGGLHEIGNLVIACAQCNRAKGARTPDEWRAAG
jgi:5-methylcytosine-specific restriction endonuclease McrA